MIGLLGWFVVSDLSSRRAKAQMTETLSVARQFHMGAQQAALDGSTTGDSTIGWPADVGAKTAHEYVESMVRQGYVDSRVGDQVIQTCLIGNVSESDPPGTIILKLKTGIGSGKAIFRKTDKEAALEVRQLDDGYLPPPRDPQYLPN